MSGPAEAEDQYDLFVSYAHADDREDGWVAALVEAIRAEHARFTPQPLKVFFDRQGIRVMDDWEPIQPAVHLLEKVYEKGVRVAKKAFKKIEDCLERD